jgi:hypothetical protein
MSCVHLKEINRVCSDNGVHVSQSDLVRIVCKECGDHEVCPSNPVQFEGEAAVELPVSDAPLGVVSESVCEPSQS